MAQAGRHGAVTISTNMAGRGTDIVLGGNPEFLALAKCGGDRNHPEYLATLAEFERSARAERERGGRGGRAPHPRHRAPREPPHRQPAARPLGPPGRSRARASSSSRSRTTCCASSAPSASSPGWSASASRTARRSSTACSTRAIENAQKKVEARNFDIRKHLLDYDNVMNKQRQAFYGRRRELLAREDVHDEVLDMTEGVLVGAARRALAREGRARTPSSSPRSPRRSRRSSAWRFDPAEPPFRADGAPATRPRRARPRRARRGCSPSSRRSASAATRIAEEYAEIGYPHFADFEREHPAADPRPPVEGPPAHDGRAARGHQPARLRAARSEDRVPARGLRAVRGDERAHRPAGARGALQVRAARAAARRRAAAAGAAPRCARPRAAHAASAGAAGPPPGRAAPPAAAPGARPGRRRRKVGRNDPCPCGSGKKYKKCCGAT